MNRILKLLITATCLSGLCTVVCKDNPGSSAPQPESILFDDYVLFDTWLYIIQRSNVGWIGPEWYLSCESSLGEPFIDVNGNGVYDPGIDLFVMSVGPDNMDYNNNGKHDGPDDPWEPGIPFDDHDGDGERFCDPDWAHSPHYYEPWMPFCDMNGNGQWDSLPDLRHSVVKWNRSGDGSEGFYYFPVYDDSLFRYASGSGVPHWQPESPEDLLNTWVTFFVDDSGLIGHLYFGPPGHLRLLYLGDNDAGTARVPFTTSFCPSASLRRTLQTNQTLEVSGNTYTDLLLIKFDDPRDDSGQIVSCGSLYWEYYFAKSVGLIAYHYEYDNSTENWYYFDQQFDGSQPMMNSFIGCQPGQTEDHVHAR